MLLLLELVRDKLSNLASMIFAPKEKLMAKSFLFMILFSLISLRLSSSAVPILTQGSSLYVENVDDVLISTNGVFSVGFYPVGQNAYCFAIWFTKPRHDGTHAIVWMANRDFPVNGRRSKLSILKTGTIIITDADQSTVWSWTSNDTVTDSWSQLNLLDSGNLVLQTRKNVTLWQSFDSPTDTLLPGQPLTRHNRLVSARSQTDYSSGNYKLMYDFDNVLRLAFDGPETSSIYWPDPTLLDYEQGRYRYNDSRIAVFDTSGHFISSDEVQFFSTDFGKGPWRRLTLDFNGNLRLYTFEEEKGIWFVTWQAMSKSYKIHGICGLNSVCSYDPGSGPKCSCLPGFKMKNQADWNDGCEPEFKFSCSNHDLHFVNIRHVNFFGYHSDILYNYTLEECEKACLNSCCVAYQYRYFPEDGAYRCYPKLKLLNGYRSPSYQGTLYLKLPKSFPYNKPVENFRLNCSNKQTEQLNRAYHKTTGYGSLKILMWCASIIGLLEMICIFLVFSFLHKTGKSSASSTQGYHAAATGFKRFTYNELKKATRGFSEEIGRGGGGVVYKGVLPDRRIAAFKRLNIEANNQGEEEFLAEVSTIGRLNHMNLIEMWGYCAEGKHRLLVYEYMENGSLANNLESNSLDWKKKFDIAVGTAKGLAYLHEELLEWVLHCDVKPQNIVLDSNYHPKVADFGLSKLLNRDSHKSSSFSKVRGTRGYMAPEWVYNLPITSKVDVYSYGIVVLEMLTGMNSTIGVPAVETGEVRHQSLVARVKGKKNGAAATKSWVGELIDPAMGYDYDKNKLENLLEVAMKCTDSDRHARPSMSQVVEMLLVD